MRGIAMDASRLRLRLSNGVDGHVVVRVEGELDLSDVRRLRDVLATVAESAAVVVLDLADLSFVDLCGLRAFHDAHEAAARRGSRLVLMSPGPAVTRYLELTGINGFEISGDRTILGGDGSAPG